MSLLRYQPRNIQTTDYDAVRLRRLGFGDDNPAPRLEHNEREQRSQNIRTRRDQEHTVPRAGRLLHVIRDRHQQGRGAFGRVEQAGVRGREFRAEGVGAGRWEQRIDLTPGEEYQPGEYHEPYRIVAEHIKRPDADTLDAESDEHRVLAADLIGDPAEERAGQAVENAIVRRCDRH